ncbi:KH domain-containing protein akap-1 [Onthophagus taurus]|uniref:KH domain-containing protein akap-1 n=1 Tax=Onthophagus taurus TaxID=166361 RepID=UPI000C207BDE|nr:KH domain-containing protein akap-1-like [Onthophagus taurus]XP_022917559.1 KH domain-containing protein akap-1-like [Onthophagus taurus]XP_022917560.1 KH domain-containing protein akap-1-like [Onthophagus taurus]XP_022917561.1 KH domain-containing protein akap-1-like [Onthophagus taurus]XP_022918378.1 KH domain-containing protein akap-1-like [Onthophagus taurus]
MAFHQSRLLLVLASLPLVGIIGYLWLRRKDYDEEDFDSPEQCEEISTSCTSLEKDIEITTISCESPEKVFSRSLSGITSTPIDIIIPRQLRAHKSAPVFISDEDLDLEIEKIKSMKNNNYQWKEGNNKTAEPVKEEMNVKVGEIECERATLMPASPMEKATTSSTNMSPKLTKSSPKSSPISMKSSPKSSSPKYKSPKVIKCTPQKTILSSSTSPKDQKQAKSVEEQFNSLNLSQKKQSPPKECVVNNVNEEIQRQSSERDSANHSPCDVMLASPAPSSISDNQSEGSNDSGKGGSDVATPPSQTPANDGSISGDAVDSPMPVMYQFTIPQHCVGRLIGRGGTVIQDIKSKSHTNVLVKKHPGNTKMKICVIEGTQLEIDNALHLIRERFPLKKYPEITLEQLIVAPSLTPDQLGLRLIEGINNDTMVSFMMEPNRFFIQFPTHPSFPSLNILSTNMTEFYNTNETPAVPLPIADFTICACHLDGFWYRVMVTKSDAETDSSHVTLLDYGGYYWVENSRLRQISGDFLLLPFQATECILANIRPIGGESTWPKEAYEVAAELANRALACTQVADYTSNGIPLVYMYIVAGHQDIVFLNQELVDRGYAEWISYSQVESRTTTTRT